jgi:hypothetical protein
MRIFSYQEDAEMKEKVIITWPGIGSVESFTRVERSRNDPVDFSVGYHRVKLRLIKFDLFKPMV